MRDRLSYANVAATLALLLALGGTGAYAAQTLAPRSVGERQLRPGAVTSQKLRKSAVTTPKLAPLAVKQGKLAGGSVTAEKLAPAAVSASALQSDSVTNEKIAPEAVTGDKVNESTLSQVPAAAKAEFATEAESANPEAFAHVGKDASLDANLSKGIAQVKAGSLAGIYCISASGFNPRGAQVTPQFNVSGQITAYVTIGGTAECPAPEVEVQTFDGGTRAKEAFYAVLYR
jgi:hypothetical protein